MNNYIYFEDNKGHYMVIDSNNKNIRWKKKMHLNMNLFDFTSLPVIYEYNIKDKVSSEITNKYLEDKQTLYIEEIDNPVNVIEDIKGSNSKIFSTTNNTNIDQDVIEKMKKENNSNDIIKTIIESNNNFDSRTQFSKEKYLKRKINKYINIFIFQKPNIYLINKYFHYSKMNEYYPIGLDSISYITQNIDISSNSHILLSEKTKGCLLSLILEEFEEDSVNKISIVDKDLNKNYFQCLKYMKYEDLFNKHCKLIDSKEETFYDFIVICSDFDAISIIDSVKDKLNPGCRLIIFKNYIDELNELGKYLFKEKIFIDINITELFLRKMQILPLRCHPEMMSKTHQGFLLTCYKIN